MVNLAFIVITSEYYYTYNIVINIHTWQMVLNSSSMLCAHTSRIPHSSFVGCTFKLLIPSPFWSPPRWMDAGPISYFFYFENWKIERFNSGSFWPPFFCKTKFLIIYFSDHQLALHWSFHMIIQKNFVLLMQKDIVTLWLLTVFPLFQHFSRWIILWFQILK